jgi:hypothetical protein
VRTFLFLTSSLRFPTRASEKEQLLSEIVGDGDTTVVACIIPLSGFALCRLIGIDATRMIDGE